MLSRVDISAALEVSQDFIEPGEANQIVGINLDSKLLFHDSHHGCGRQGAQVLIEAVLALGISSAARSGKTAAMQLERRDWRSAIGQTREAVEEGGTPSRENLSGQFEPGFRRTSQEAREAL
jgi:hypothetical protein